VSPTILVLCPDAPYPVYDGPRIDMLEGITFLEELGWRCIVVICRVRDHTRHDFTPLPGIATYQISRNPRWSLREDPTTIHHINDLITEYAPHVVMCVGADFAPLAARLNLRGARLWFRTHEFLLAHTVDVIRGRKRPASLRTALYDARRLARIYLIERQMNHIADHIWHIGYGDMRAMRHLYSHHTPQTWLLPHIVRAQLLPHPDKRPLDVIFPGSDYQYFLNIDAAHKLLGEIVPAVEGEMPGMFCFHITGHNSQTVLAEYASNYVRLYGHIENLGALLAKMDAACLPVESGWGMKLKLAESLACGLPIVGASQTFRGVPRSQDAYVVCHTLDDYVKAFRALLNDEHRTALGSAAYREYQRWREEGEHALINALGMIVRESDPTTTQRRNG
jgi:glycosyltransferase involved in cell wall biosynthesis